MHTPFRTLARSIALATLLLGSLSGGTANAWPWFPPSCATRCANAYNTCNSSCTRMNLPCGAACTATYNSCMSGCNP